MKVQKILIILLNVSSFAQANFYLMFSPDQDTKDKIKWAKEKKDQILKFQTESGNVAGLSNLLSKDRNVFFDKLEVNELISFPILSPMHKHSQVTMISSHTPGMGDADIDIEDKYIYLLSYNKSKKQFELKDKYSGSQALS